MALLEVQGLSMSYDDKQLYTEAEFELQAGEHLGIVGQNGTGKSTLIKLITEQILPVSGTIKWQKGTSIGYLDQYAAVTDDLTVREFLATAFTNLYQMEAQMSAYYEQFAETGDEQLLMQAGQIQEQLEQAEFYDLDTKVEKVITGLGLNDIADHKTAQLSGGQRSKIILAKLLLANDEVLLLDEPTNYLDTVHIAWLVTFLQAFDGTTMIVSHDYDFLEQVTNSIVDIAFGKMTKYRGSFQEAMRQKNENRKRQLREFTQQQELIAKTQKFIDKNQAGTKAKQAKSRGRMLDKMNLVDAPDQDLRSYFDFPVYQPVEAEMEDPYAIYDEPFETGPVAPATTLTVNNLTVGYDQALLQPISFEMVAGQKLALVGFNGAGKSTLIKTLLGKITSLAGTSKFTEDIVVNYFNQDLTWENDQLTPLDVLRDQFPEMELQPIRRSLNNAGINKQNAQKPLALLSGGEQAKVKLALMTLTPSNFLIMDEPTNHLDEATKQALQRALKKFTGNLILVSHEADFYQDWLPDVLDISALSLNTPTD
ncbi:ABC-F family ATP-binding cassette domain-containing protein [Periweissella ghanensis]|uniref:ABC transporter ATP-binding protein YbiT n=1 Tax=Periweissella ghanensis TaxID=467997 RepID=A0ABM8ZAI9_9LACO|nr:ABC-F family ATP-binding cassette domain-containing protein [Periweissella ghanensis]MCM0600571.1 ABC-F family ATP-binding cassette domain-containing protein [Periweissella ghanensis]CAH0418346.1 putative ABC transporter ATP-binding protein YbiT [Periweissella ghanensis]